MTAVDVELREPEKPPFYRDTRILRVVAQVAVVGVVAAIIYVLWFNLTNNLARQGIDFNLGFLDNPGGVNIAGSDISSNASLRRLISVGIKNTFALAIVGIPLLTIIGTLIGIARLSTNWIVNRFAALYVETLRNIPPLLVIFIAFFAVILQLPPAREPATPGPFVISNLRISVPWFETSNRAFWWVLAVAAVIAIGVGYWRTKLSERSGVPHRRVLWGLGTVAVIGTIAYLALGRPVGITTPEANGAAVAGGLSGLGSYFAMLLALVLYTASHVAEIVRGSIQAVSKGQSEAANALALTPFQRYRYVVLPQAMRIAIPPIISQYLNFVKNTSLALAIGYAEVTTVVFQAIGNGNPAPQLIFILMGAYLLFSLTISLAVNALNRRLQLVNR